MPVSPEWRKQNMIKSTFKCCNPVTDVRTELVTIFVYFIIAICSWEAFRKQRRALRVTVGPCNGNEMKGAERKRVHFRQQCEVRQWYWRIWKANRAEYFNNAENWLPHFCCFSQVVPNGLLKFPCVGGWSHERRKKLNRRSILYQCTKD